MGSDLTKAQKRALAALIDGPLPAGAAAERAGYSGRMGSPYGGAGRAPMWWGRMMKNMPDGLIQVSFHGPSKRYELTVEGRKVVS